MIHAAHFQSAHFFGLSCHIAGDSWSVPVAGSILIGLLGGILPGPHGKPAIPLVAEVELANFPSPRDASPTSDTTTEPDPEDLEFDVPPLAEVPVLRFDADLAGDGRYPNTDTVCCTCTKEFEEGSLRMHMLRRGRPGQARILTIFCKDCFITWVVQEGKELSVLSALIDLSATDAPKAVESVVQVLLDLTSDSQVEADHHDVVVVMEDESQDIDTFGLPPTQQQQF